MSLGMSQLYDVLTVQPRSAAWLTQCPKIRPSHHLRSCRVCKAIATYKMSSERRSTCTATPAPPRIHAWASSHRSPAVPLTGQRQPLSAPVRTRMHRQPLATIPYLHHPGVNANPHHVACPGPPHSVARSAPVHVSFPADLAVPAKIHAQGGALRQPSETAVLDT